VNPKTDAERKEIFIKKSYLLENLKMITKLRNSKTILKKNSFYYDLENEHILEN
jgi:hypothetical protein